MLEDILKELTNEFKPTKNQAFTLTLKRFSWQQVIEVIATEQDRLQVAMYCIDSDNNATDTSLCKDYYYRHLYTLIENEVNRFVYTAGRRKEELEGYELEVYEVIPEDLTEEV